MRLISFAGRGIMVGALHNNEVVMLDSVADDMLSLIEMGPSGLKRARQVIAEGMPRDLLPLDQVKLLAPLPRLSKNIVCLGMNYVEHAYESMQIGRAHV